ncbi:hypothetical protein JCM10212_002234 [Sporobolomyces blumeae]
MSQLGMEPSAGKSTAAIGVNPRHLGLPRRQSYDPLSSTKGSLGLSLGQLPPPTFGNIPAGLRSVPAVDSNRHFISSAFRNVSAPLGDGQRTPGGSLVIGAEVFGFGAPAKKEPRERWGTGSVDGGEEAATAKLASDWPSEFDVPVAKEAGASRAKHGPSSLSADFAATGLPPPAAAAPLTSAALRSPSPTGVVMNDVPYRSAASVSHLPIHSGGTSTTTDTSQEVSPIHSTSSDPTTAGTSGGTSAGHFGRPAGVGASSYAVDGGVAHPSSASSPSGQPYVYPYQPPDPSPPPLGNPYFAQSFSAMPINNRNGSYMGYGPAEPQMSPDELAFGLRGMHLGGGGAGGGGGGGGRAGGSGVGGGMGGGLGGRNPSHHHPGGGREPPARQNSSGFQPYYMASPASPYLPHQDAYSPISFGAPSPFYANGLPNGGPTRRDSVPVPGWGLSMPPFGFHPEYSQPGSSVPSRQGSLSYGASGPQPSGLSAYSTNGAPPHQFAGSAGVEPVPPPYATGPQLGQQHQILLGRAVRGVEYIAPGPAGQGYNSAAAFGPDMRNLRSAVLDEFRTNRNRTWELPDLAGHVVEFAGDQLGSRHIQTKLDTATTDEKAMVFQEILPNMLQLSTDVFANYVIQKFFEQGTQVQKTAMAKTLEGHVLPLSLQMYGCRVVQKALEYVLVDQQVRLVKELDGHVLKCARDAQSNHVVQRALERVPPEHLTFITDACLGQVHDLATHPYGCRVLQRIFENCPPQQSRALLDELHRYTQNLVQDQYGNYVIQWVIEKGEKADRSHVISIIYGQVLPLAQQKFASNVVEKCIIHGTPDERRRIIDELLAPAPDGSSVIKTMLAGAFSNYVIQQALKWSVGPQREAMFSETAIQLANLRKYSTTYSKHLVTIEKLLQGEQHRMPY